MGRDTLPARQCTAVYSQPTCIWPGPDPVFRNCNKAKWKSASGETDMPDQMAEFIIQRRRWLNGSFFAAVYAIAHFYQLWRSDHSFMRKMVLLIEFIYQTINMLFAWLAIVCSLVSVFYYPLIRIIMRLGQSLLSS
jgi:cellulose synthase/poly-beta-1,6-N-acetylglucosamine synthase-like glycosyltransferase